MTDQVLRQYSDNMVVKDLDQSSRESGKRRNDDLLQRLSTKEENAPVGIDRFSVASGAMMESGHMFYEGSNAELQAP